MSDVRVRAVSKRFGTTQALDQVDLDVASGDLVAVLGPSGCGKTTLLRCIAGFERLDAGSVELGGRPVAGPGLHLPSHRRQVAVVPQDGALFPHLSVAGNVGFGLPRATRRARVAECLDLVGLAGLGRRMPHELSGGQQQRVAVARALAPRPPLVLLDEPFSALDAALRVGLRRDIREALVADGATAMLVTHDQNEALSMADHVAVLRDGRILQVAEPATLYREPVDTWVAGFVGEATVLPVELDDAGQARCALGTVETAATHDGDRLGTATGEHVVVVRPEQVQIVGPGVGAVGHCAPGARGVTAVVRDVDYHGHDALIRAEVAEGLGVLVRVPDGPYAGVAPGALLELAINGRVRVLPGDTAGPIGTGIAVD